MCVYTIDTFKSYDISLFIITDQFDFKSIIINYDII